MPQSPQEDARRFLHPATIGRIGRLEIRARQVVEGFIAGLHKSPVFGHSIEFLQHREYTHGDDIRHLDWKVWSRTDRYVIKQYEEETNLRATMIVEVSESMRYGAGAMNKYDYACTAAACLSYLLLRQHDAVGLVTFDSQVRTILPARSQMSHLDAFVMGLHQSKPAKKTDFSQVMRRVAESVGQRGLIIVFSDFLVDRPELFKGLEMLRHRRHDILAFHVLDTDEINFPFTGSTKFEGMEEQPDLLCDPRSLRDGYMEALDKYLVDVRRGCTKLGIDYQMVTTGDYLDAVLSKFLNMRLDDRNARGNGGTVR